MAGDSCSFLQPHIFTLCREGTDVSVPQRSKPEQFFHVFEERASGKDTAQRGKEARTDGPVFKLYVPRLCREQFIPPLGYSAVSAVELWLAAFKGARILQFLPLTQQADCESARS